MTLKATKEYRNRSGLYALRCLINDKVYIGQTKNFQRRLREHIYSLRKGSHRNPELQSEFTQYGEDNFEFEILLESSENLDDYERNAIDKARSSSGCYNVFSGGKTGYTATQEFRDQVSKRFKGRKDSEVTRRKKSANAKKQWQNESFRSLMANSAKRQWRDDEYRKAMYKAHKGKPEANGHKLTAAVVVEARLLHEQGISTKDLAEKYGVSYPTMVSALNRRSWKNI